MSNLSTKKERLPAIEYIRGISMLGVIGIHVGSQYLMNPSSNVHLVALFEIVTRFAVPIFFFISAFGLFYNLEPGKQFDYLYFLRRRFKTVLIPYIIWSLFYIIHDNCYYGYGVPSLDYLIKLLFFGLAKYHLYFLVILLWFYLLMPVWIKIVQRMTGKKLFLLLLLQIAFDYFSSYSEALNNLTYSLPEESLIRWFLLYRLNYLILHYVFIFVLGGFLAVHIEKFFTFMRQNKMIINFGFIVSLLILLAHYYVVIFLRHLPPEAAVNIAHQLSPAGIIYTITASVFWFTIFSSYNFGSILKSALSFCGRHSYFAYLFHPLLITYLSLLLQSTGRVMTASIAILFYFITVIISLLIASTFRKLGNKHKLINKLTIGA